MMWIWCLPRVREEEKHLSIQCGDRECRPMVYNAGSSYIILYKRGEWWLRLDWTLCGGFTDADVKQIKEMAQRKYNMYYEKSVVSNI